MSGSVGQALTPPTPITTRGDTVVGNSSGAPSRLPIGTAGKVLQSDGTDPSWQTLDLDDVSDVAITSAARYNTLVHDGATFENKPGPYTPLGRDAAWDGTTNDTAAIHSTLSDASAGSYARKVILPGGSANIQSGIVLRSKAHLKGEGMFNTRLVTAASLANAIQSSASFPMTELVIEDLAIDCTNVTVNAMVLYGYQVHRILIRNLYLYNLSAIGASFSGVDTVDIENIIGVNQGLGDGSFLTFSAGFSNVNIRKAWWRWLANGLTVDTGSSTPEFDSGYGESFNTDHCYGDLMWYLLPVQGTYTSSGGSVTYDATHVYDSGAAFSSLGSANGRNVRAMPVRCSGTFTAAPSNKTCTDSAGAFDSSGILRGELIRSGTKYGVISGPESATTLHIEQWLDTTTHAPTTPPSSGASYTVYGIHIGLLQSFTGTSITVNFWHDLEGTQVTPTSGTLYEVMRDKPNYNINIESSCRHYSDDHSVMRRGWSDQFSIFASDAKLIGSRAEDGEDMGFTINAGSTWGNTDGHHQLIGVKAVRQGASGIFANSPDLVLVAPDVRGWQRCNHNNGVNAGIYIEASTGDGGKRNVIEAPMCDGLGWDYTYAGIVVRDAAGDAQDVTIRDPNIKRVSEADIRFYGSGHVRCKVLDYDFDRSDVATAANRIQYQGGATGQQVSMWGSGSPESVVTASVGSQFRRTDGGAGTTLYQKESGTGNTGWVAR